MYSKFLSLPVFFGVLLLVGCDYSSAQQVQAPPQATPAPPSTRETGSTEFSTNGDEVTRLNAPKAVEAEEIEWDALIPEDWRPDTLMDEYNAEDLSDDDPRAQQLLEKLKALWKEAPVVPTLEGRLVKLPGFVVPLEMDEKKIDQFLLVPYYGACIHVPPPPANQTVHVVTKVG